MRRVSAQWKTTRDAATAAGSAGSVIHINPRASVHGRPFSSSSTCVTVSIFVDRPGRSAIYGSFGTRVGALRGVQTTHPLGSCSSSKGPEAISDSDYRCTMELSATPKRRYQPIGITTGDLTMKILASNLIVKTAVFVTLLLAVNFIPSEASAACLDIDRGGSTRAQAWVNHCGVEVGVRWNDEGHCRRGKNGYRYPCALLVPRATTGRNGRNSERFTGYVNWYECRGAIPSEQNGQAYCN